MRFLLLGIGLLLLGSQQAKSSGFAIYETSVRVSGMMGAFVADGNDVSTIFFNPAGLAQLSGFRFAGGAEIITPNTTFRGPYPYSVAEEKMLPQSFTIPNLYASYQVMPDLTVGLGFYVPFGLGSKWDRNWVYAAAATETEIQTAVLAPAVGYRFNLGDAGKLSVGASFQIGMIGKATLEKVPNDVTQPMDGTHRLVHLDGDVKETFTGYTFGLIYQPMDMLSIGFTYKSQLELNFTGVATFEGLPSNLYPDKSEGDLTIVTPMNWSLGISFKPDEQLTLNLDYIFWGWSSFDSLNIDFKNPILPDNKTYRGYKDVYQIRFGAEYKFNESFMARAGIGFDKNPVPDETIDPTLPDTDRLLFSVGGTYYVTNNIGFNAYYMFVRGNERLSNNVNNPNKGYYNTFANIFGAGVTLAF